MNWFINTFLKSFEDCVDKRISEKQANIFRKYLKEVKEHECSTDFTDVIDNRQILFQDSTEWVGYRKLGHRYYLTIR